MTVRAAIANGNWTTATTWGAIDATSLNNVETANTAITTSYVESTAFTPGAITIDAILVRIASRTASPAGTMSIRLAQAGSLVVGTEVTVNISDIPLCTAASGSSTPLSTSEGGWFCMKFAAPVTLVAATAYTVSAKTSNSSQVNLYSLATTNWARALRTTTTGAPAAGDDLIIVGEWTAAATMTARTVTMNSTTATDYGSNTTVQVTPALAIGNGGTLTWGTSAATSYILQLSGYLIVYKGGIYNQGQSGAETPRGSTATLQFDCVADGDFGLVCREGSTVNLYGLSRTSGKNVTWCKLNANASAAATGLTLDTDTGWLSGDIVCLAPTSRTSTEFESKALTGNATATTVAITALTNAHSGTSPAQGEVGLITRNNVLKAVTTNVCTFVYIAASAVFASSWSELAYLGQNAQSNKLGIQILTTTGSCLIDSCSVHDNDCEGIIASGGTLTNLTITNNVIYNWGVATNASGIHIQSSTSGTWTISGNMLCGSNGGNSVGINLSDVGGILTNNSVSGNSGSGGSAGYVIAEAHVSVSSFSGNVAHSNGGAGFEISSSVGGSLTGLKCWRNGNTGLDYSVSMFSDQSVTISGEFFGNTGNNIAFSGIGSAVYVILDGCTVSGDSSFSTTTGLLFRGTGVIQMWGCLFSQITGIKTIMTNDFDFNSTSSTIQVKADNCKFGATNLFTNISGTPGYGLNQVPFLTSQKHNQVASDNRAYFGNSSNSVASVIKSNFVTLYSTNPLSEEMQPGSSVFKFPSASIKIAVTSGRTITPTVQVQKNGTYNGNAPRLIVRRQDSIGITSDTVLATFSASANTWQALSGTTAIASQDGVMEFIVDCDGTAGSVFVGDVTAIET